MRGPTLGSEKPGVWILYEWIFTRICRSRKGYWWDSGKPSLQCAEAAKKAMVVLLQNTRE